MAIESMKYKIHTEELVTQEILHTENVKEHLCALSDQLFQKEREVGFGNYARVYSDPEAGLVYKKEKPLSNPKNNVHEEASFLSRLTNISKDVMVPLPVVSFTADLRREKDAKPVRQNVLVMQEIKGNSLDKMLPRHPGLKPELPFPKNFNPDEFFPALRKFIQSMHTEQNIYHRDVADRNIMIDEKTGRPVLIDFGNAVEFDERYAEDGEIDAYGRKVINDGDGGIIKRKDLDLDAIDQLEEVVRGFLTNNN